MKGWQRLPSFSSADISLRSLWLLSTGNIRHFKKTGLFVQCFPWWLSHQSFSSFSVVKIFCLFVYNTQAAVAQRDRKGRSVDTDPCKLIEQPTAEATLRKHKSAHIQCNRKRKFKKRERVVYGGGGLEWELKRVRMSCLGHVLQSF